MSVSIDVTPEILPSILVIGGEGRSTGAGGTMQHVNPTNGRIQQTFPVAGSSDVEEAVAQAKGAFEVWRHWHPKDRRRALSRLADLLRIEGKNLGTTAALESGIPSSPGMSMASSSADWIEYAAGWADRIEGRVVDSASEGAFKCTVEEPVGVVAVILTWNGPIMSLGMCVAPALAAGCSVIIKPSELAPFSSMRFGLLAVAAGLPPGAVSVLTGGWEVGDALIRHPDVAKVSFTGGTQAAKTIATTCAQTLKPAVYELGGKSANIVFPDADLTQASESVLSMCRLSGQSCTLASRHIVHGNCYEEYLDRISILLKGVAIGDPLDPMTQMGPVINEAACNRIMAMIDEAQIAGMTPLIGGSRLGGHLADGYFIEPTVFADVDRGARLAREEVFGPVLVVMRFEEEEEALAIANDSEYGLAGYVHTRDLDRALRIASALNVGTVGVNGGSAPSGPNTPFGGRRRSGYGSVGGLSGIQEYLHAKSINIRMQ